MSDFNQLLIFRLDEQRYALPINVVERIVRAVEVTPLPDGPAIVMGIINMGGRIFPVLNVRERFGLPARDISPASQFLVATTSRRGVVLAIDEAQEVVADAGLERVNTDGIVPGMDQIQGVVTMPNGMALIHDLEKFLSLDEESRLNEAMREVTRDH